MHFCRVSSAKKEGVELEVYSQAAAHVPSDARLAEPVAGGLEARERRERRVKPGHD